MRFYPAILVFSFILNTSSSYSAENYCGESLAEIIHQDIILRLEEKDISKIDRVRIGSDYTSPKKPFYVACFRFRGPKKMNEEVCSFGRFNFKTCLPEQIHNERMRKI